MRFRKDRSLCSACSADIEELLPFFVTVTLSTDNCWALKLLAGKVTFFCWTLDISMVWWKLGVAGMGGRAVADEDLASFPVLFLVGYRQVRGKTVKLVTLLKYGECEFILY